MAQLYPYLSMKAQNNAKKNFNHKFTELWKHLRQRQIWTDTEKVKSTSFFCSAMKKSDIKRY